MAKPLINFRNTSSVKQGKDIRSYLERYFNELTKPKRKPRPDKADCIPKVLGRDYLSGQRQGLVTVHGTLRAAYFAHARCLPENGYSPEALAEAIRLASFGAAAAFNSNAHAALLAKGLPPKFVHAAAAKGKDVAFKFMFSLSDETHASWIAAGVDIDAGLRHIAVETLRRYSLGVMDGAEIGFALSVHHDTANFHVHGLGLLRAENGTLLRLTNNLAVKDSLGVTHRVDHATILTNTATAVCGQYQHSLAPDFSLADSRDPSRIIDRLLCLHACDNDKKDPAREYARIRQAPPSEIIAAMEAARAKRAATLKRLQLSAAEGEESLAKLAAIARTQRERLNQFFFRAIEAAATARLSKSRLDKDAAAAKAVLLSHHRTNTDLYTCATLQRIPIWLARASELLAPANAPALEEILELFRHTVRTPVPLSEHRGAVPLQIQPAPTQSRPRVRR